MIDWTASMDQSFEFYIVDPNTWKDRIQLRNVKTCTITRDSDSETLGSATIDVDEPIGECYIRVYLIARQNGYREKRPLGTFLIQTPSTSFDGKSQSYSIDAYTPLIELKETLPPIGYSLRKGEKIMECAYRLAREQMRAPVVATDSRKELFYNFVSNTDDTWLTFLSDLISNAEHTFDLDELGRVLFSPRQETAALQPVWTFNDDNSSILLPEITIDRDLYGIPNVVEIVYSDPDSKASNAYYYARCVNDDPDSPTSIVNRGREIVYRETDPDLIGDPTEHQIHVYAERRLKELSSLECTVTYKHGYCPTRVGDCVRLNYSRADLLNVKARIVSQTITCDLGCQVTEKAVFTTKLWR